MKRFAAILGLVLMLVALPTVSRAASQECVDGQLCGTSLQSTGTVPQASVSDDGIVPLQQTGQGLQGQSGQTGQLSAADISKQWAAADQDSPSPSSAVNWLSVAVLGVGIAIMLVAIDGLHDNFARTERFFARLRRRS